MIEPAKNGLGAAIPFGGEMLDAGPTDRDEGELGGNKKSVGGDEKTNGDES